MAITLAGPTLTATADLGLVTFTYQFDSTPDSTAGNVNIQAFLLDTTNGQYVTVQPKDSAGAPLSIPVYPAGAQNRGSFSLPMAAGTYTTGKLSVFADGSNFGTSLGDYPLASVALTVTTAQLRVTAAAISVDDSKLTVGPVAGKLLADGKTPDTASYVQVPYSVKFPHGMTNTYNGFFLMAKGSGGYVQPWVLLSAAKQNTDPLDNYDLLTGTFVLPVPASAGLYNLQYGLYDYNWKQYNWIYPGTDFAIGDWVVKADPAGYPSVAAAFAPGKAPFALGGDFGNAIASIGTAADVDPNYFRLLKALGLNVLRTNYDPDQYLALPIYRDKVDQIVQSCLSAGVVPCLAPQNLPAGANLAAQGASLLTLAQMVATRYKGVPVVLDVLNEPYQYATWAAWAAVAQPVAAAIKAIDPNMKVVVGAEGYSEDMTGPSAAPLPAGLVDWYGWHSYHSTVAQLPAKAGKTIPVWLQEYHSADPAFHAALEGIPNLKAVAAWAWTTPGQDSINLVAAWQGASLTLTPDGQAIAGFYATWNAGGRVQATPPIPPPPASPPSPPAVPPASPPASGITQAQAQALIKAQAALDLASWQKNIADAVSAQAAVDAKAQSALAQSLAAASAKEAADAAKEASDLAAGSAKEQSDAAAGAAKEQSDLSAAAAKEATDLSALADAQTAQTQQMLDDTMTNVQSVTDALQAQIDALKAQGPAVPDFTAASNRMKAALDASPTLTVAALRTALYKVISALAS